ncbi:uncharacterized protein [Hemitrygon akajei]|uniref:uncharacterized protein isoform X2 n=1 Tax=Hemitrygon akajei TaxID=2704970 RepID=UPI003BF9EC5F
MVKDELVARDDSDSLDSLISLATRLNNHLWERRRERTGHPPPLDTSRLSLLPLARTSLSPPPALQVAPSPANSTAPGEEPLQLGWNCLSPAERLRRMRTESRLDTKEITCASPGNMMQIENLIKSEDKLEEKSAVMDEPVEAIPVQAQEEESPTQPQEKTTKVEDKARNLTSDVCVQGSIFHKLLNHDVCK